MAIYGNQVGGQASVKQAGNADTVDQKHASDFASASYVSQAVATMETALGGKANSTHTHAAGDITSGTIPVTNGGTGASDTYNAQLKLKLHGGAAITADDEASWRTQAQSIIVEACKSQGFASGQIGWNGKDFGWYMAATCGPRPAQILALVSNGIATKGCLEVWRYSNGTWSVCGVTGNYLRTNATTGYGTTLPSAGTAGRIFFKKA